MTRTELIAHLREYANDHRQVAHDCDTNPEATLNWQHALCSEQAADMLEADAVNDDLTIAYMSGFKAGEDKYKAAARLALDALKLACTRSDKLVDKEYEQAIAALKDVL